MIEKFKHIFSGLERAHGVTKVGESNGNGTKVKGKSLIDIVIENSKKSKFLTDIYLTSEDYRILKNAKKKNIKIIVRPKNLSKTMSFVNCPATPNIEFIKINRDAEVAICLGYPAFIRKRIGLKNIPPPIPTTPEKKPIIDPIIIE